MRCLIVDDSELSLEILQTKLAGRYDIVATNVPGNALKLARDTEPDLLFHHSRRVFLFGALTGRRRGLRFDAELLYVGALFHDMGLVPAYSSADQRFEPNSSPNQITPRRGCFVL